MESKILSFFFLLAALTTVSGSAISGGAYDTNSPRKAKCDFPKMEEKEDYLKMRKRLLHLGLSLDPMPDNPPFSMCEAHPRVCRRFPEVESCTVDDGHCQMRFINKAGTILRVVTEGDDPGASFVVGWDVFCATDPKHPAP